MGVIVLALSVFGLHGRLQTPQGRCLVYEDADAGVTAAFAAGMTAYSVRTGQLLHP